MQNLKKSICIIVTKGNCGGAQQYVSMLANKAASVNWEVTVVIGDGGGFESLITDSRIKVIRQLGFSNKSILPDLLLLKWILKNRFRFSIFHFNSSKCLLIGWVLKLFSRKLKTIFTVHGVPWIARSPAILNRIPFVLFKFFLKSYDQIIFVSQFVSETILLNESVNYKKSVIIRNTIHPQRVSIGKLDLSKPLGTQKLTAVSLTELNKNKGLIEMINAINVVKSNLIGRFEWHIYGDGALKEKISEQINQLGLKKIVRLMGYSSSIAKNMSLYDLLLIPSINEAFGLAALEASAAGVFVLGMKVGGIPEAIISNEYGCSFETHASIAQAINEKIEFPNKYRCSQPIPMSNLENRFNDWWLAHYNIYDELSRDE